MRAQLFSIGHSALLYAIYGRTRAREGVCLGEGVYTEVFARFEKKLKRPWTCYKGDDFYNLTAVIK